MAFCKQCNKWITQPEGKRKKEFCNNTCRSNFWYGKNKKGLKKPVEFVTPRPEVYDAPRLPSSVEDEPFSFDKARKEIPAQKGVIEWEAELMAVEDAADLERIGRQIERSSLWWKDKQYLKSRGMAIYQQKFAF